MLAAVIYEKGGPEKLILERRPVPVPEPGKVLIRIRAFGLNRSEMFTRWGHSEGKVFFPRILGIECTGEVAACPSGKFRPGQQVAAIMGGLGRAFDGGYAEFTLVPEAIVIPFASDLPWEMIGAVPEMCQTASGSLENALELQAGEVLLVRGGTSSVGMTAAQLAKIKGCTVISTTRNPGKREKLLDLGVDEVVIDEGVIAPQIRERYPNGVDKVLELVGGESIRDSLNCVRKKGIVCQTGYLGNAWRIEGFSPLGEIPSTVRLTAYAGDTGDLPPQLLQDFLDNMINGTLNLAIDKVFKLEQIVEAHAYMESNQASGKLVVVT
ncbi:MAG: zinc-binding dehydrogenase [Bacteroidia bacterium]|nr:zinc-binding dehydrogenase [Bacteroidia bacterium]